MPLLPVIAGFVNAPTGGASAWGAITGTLSAQADLQAALDAKQTASALGSAAFVSTTTFDAAGAASSAQSAAIAASQPLDSDLTAIAALSTTSYGRALLALADAAAGRTAFGLGTLATQSGTFSGTSSGTNTGDQSLAGYVTTTTLSNATLPASFTTLAVSGDTTLGGNISLTGSNATISIPGSNNLILMSGLNLFLRPNDGYRVVIDNAVHPSALGLSITTRVASTSTGTGALIVTGGAGFTGQVTAGNISTGALAASGPVTFTGTTDSTAVGNGNVVNSGGLSVAKKLSVGGAVTFNAAGVNTIHSVLSGNDANWIQTQWGRAAAELTIGVPAQAGQFLSDASAHDAVILLQDSNPAFFLRLGINGGASTMRIGQSGLASTSATTGAVNITGGLGVSGQATIGADIVCSTAGKGLQLKSGTGARGVSVTLVGGTATTTNTTVGANTHFGISRITAGGTIGTAITVTKSNGASFTVNSDNPLDTSTFDVFLYEVN